MAVEEGTGITDWHLRIGGLGGEDDEIDASLCSAAADETPCIPGIADGNCSPGQWWMLLAFSFGRLIFLKHYLALLTSGFVLVWVSGEYPKGIGGGGKCRERECPSVGAQGLGASADVKTESPHHRALCLVLALGSGNSPLILLFSDLWW